MIVQPRHRTPCTSTHHVQKKKASLPRSKPEFAWNALHISTGLGMVAFGDEEDMGQAPHQAGQVEWQGGKVARQSTGRSDQPQEGDGRNQHGESKFPLCPNGRCAVRCCWSKGYPVHHHAVAPFVRESRMFLTNASVKLNLDFRGVDVDKCLEPKAYHHFFEFCVDRSGDVTCAAGYDGCIYQTSASRG